jgi:hypothetical protein
MVRLRVKSQQCDRKADETGTDEDEGSPTANANHSPMSRVPAPVVIKGMNSYWAISPMAKAVIGVPADSRLCAKPVTPLPRP